MEELFSIGISLTTLSNMLEINPEIKDMSNEEIKEKIELLKLINCTDKQIINIRRENPEANLQEIADIYSEIYGIKISKSGVNHRLRKIKEIANNIEE